MSAADAPRLAPLAEAGDALAFGGKAASLARLLEAGLPVPPGFALSADASEALDAGDRNVLRAVRSAYGALSGLVAVRSSAIGEDGETASFAGQHATKLGVLGETELLAAIFEVYGSAFAGHVGAYRAHHGEDGAARMGVVVQRLVAPDAAGVLFTRNPLTGAREHVIEAALGLGEAVVASLVTPDFYRLSEEGAIIEARAGDKPIALTPVAGGGIESRPVPAHARATLALGAEACRALAALASRAEAHFGGPQDIEWAIAGGEVFLLQSRPITTRA